jgi:Helix-turn-helix of DDE superfamily endonuclease
MIVELFSGLSARQFAKLVRQLRREGAEPPLKGRPWKLAFEGRVLLVAAYWRTNLTIRQIAALFGTSKVEGGPQRCPPQRTRPRRARLGLDEGLESPARLPPPRPGIRRGHGRHRPSPQPHDHRLIRRVAADDKPSVHHRTLPGHRLGRPSRHVDGLLGDTLLKVLNAIRHPE